jgi:hypothetical protein
MCWTLYWGVRHEVNIKQYPPFWNSQEHKPFPGEATVSSCCQGIHDRLDKQIRNKYKIKARFFST